MAGVWPFGDLPRGHYGAIYADPPWHFQSYDGVACVATIGEQPYPTMRKEQIMELPVAALAAPDCALFIWITWPTLEHALEVIGSWGFTYKTCAFAWVKADARQLDIFGNDPIPDMLMGYWTRSNSEVCLLATRGKPKRLNADVRQAIIEKRRQHSRKPDCVHSRIERLVAGPYLELFARARRDGWTAWGNETEKFQERAA